MEYIENFLYSIIQNIKNIINNNYNIIKFSKFYVFIYLIDYIFLAVFLFLQQVL